MKLTDVQFTALFSQVPISRVRRYADALNAGASEFDVSTLERAAAFVAQVGHESGGLIWLQELGGEEYFRKYDGRKDLGNVQPGDGYRYHGRGPIQLTGRMNYRTAGEELGLPLEDHPEIASEIEVGARIAGWFWWRRGCNELADLGSFREITRRINGGLNGIADRESRWIKACQVLGLLQPRLEV